MTRLPPADYLEISSVADLLNADLHALRPTTFWNSGKSSELKRHRIHGYPAKFPAFITTKALEFAKGENLEVRRIADIFCGCGTVPFEARRASIDFWGCDINPVATLIARTKSGRFAEPRLEMYFSEIERTFPSANSNVPLRAQALERIDYWYSPEHKQDLAKLLNSINETIPATSKYRLFFHCAFSNILKATSRWLTKSIKPQIDPLKCPLDPWTAYKDQYLLMRSAFENCAVGNSSTHISTGNFLCKRQLPNDIDLLITSPPYVTSYEYADLHQLSSLWLGYANDYRELRKGSIGSSQHALKFESEISKLNTVGSAIITDLTTKERSTAKAAANYFLDMQAVARRCHGMLSDQGLGVFIIGNTEYKGVRLNNAAHLTESLLVGGFKRVRIAKRRMTGKILTPYRDSKGRFSQSGDGRHVYGEEFVLIASKS